MYRVKKHLLALSLLLMASSIVACSPNADKETVNEPEEITKSEEVEEKSRDSSSKEITTTNFSLDEMEKETYKKFAEELNEEHLRGLEPISIAKFYVYSNLNKNYDVQYALYTTREEYIRWSKEEDEQIPETDRGTRESNLQTFNGIQNGEFIIEDDISGWIKYGNGEDIRGFSMIKDESGIWKVSFMPIQ